MSPRRFAIAVVLILSTVSAGSAGPREEKLSERESAELRALFDRAPGAMTEDANGVITVEGNVGEVVVARVDTDGTLVKACVNSEEAARLFFEKPIEQVGSGKAREK